MYEFTKTTTVYTFDELSDDAKRTAADDLLQDPWYFWTDIDAHKSWICDPHFTTRPEWQADFSFCQGDGLNIYGEFSYNELRACAGYMPLQEDITIDLKPGRDYTFSRWSGYRSYYAEDIYATIADERGEAYADRQRHIIEDICSFMDRICKDLRDYGEDLIFEVYPTESSIYEGQLFDEFGHYVCSEDDERARLIEDTAA